MLPRTDWVKTGLKLNPPGEPLGYGLKTGRGASKEPLSCIVVIFVFSDSGELQC